MPRDNRNYWRAKVISNRRRDRKNAALLRARGWSVLRVWEHSLENVRSQDRVLACLRRFVKLESARLE